MSERYLRYAVRDERPAGLKHRLRNLRWLVADAHTSGRVAELPAPALDPRHNFGVSRSWLWDTYVDLATSVLVDAGGAERRLPLVRRIPDEPSLSTLRLPPRARLPADADRFGLVVREVTDNLYLREVALGRWPTPPALRGVLPPRAPVTVRLQPSRRVLALARELIVALRGEGGYAAVHVRRGDRLVGPVRRATDPGRVCRVLRDRGVPAGTTVFLLTDERDPAYRAALGRHYRIVTARDFPEPAGLVCGEGGREPDNYLLFAVEQAVARAADLYIATLPDPDGEAVDATLVAPWRSAAYGALVPVRALVGERVWSKALRVRRALRRPRGAWDR